MENLFKNEITFKSFMKFTAPAIISMIFVSLYTIVDGMFISRYVGSNALASINIVLPISSIIFGIGIMFATGASAIIGSKLGQKKILEASTNFSLIIILSLILGFISTLLIYPLLDKILPILGATPKLYDYCKDYASIIVLIIPLSILKILFEFFLLTDGSPNLSLLSSLIGGIVNIVFDYIFIVVFKIGILGAAYGTALGILVAVIIGIIHFNGPKSKLKFVKPKFDISFLKNSCLNGSSEMVTQLSSGFVTYLFNVTAITYMGESGVAAITIILYALFLLVSIFLGFTSGAAPLISYSYGNGDQEQTNTIINYCLQFIIYTSVITFIGSLVFAPQIVGVFAKKGTDLYNLSLSGLVILSTSFLFTGINVFASGMFTAFSKGALSAIISLLRSLVFVTIGILTLPLLFGVTGIWLVIPVSELLTFTVSLYIMKKNEALLYGDSKIHEYAA